MAPVHPVHDLDRDQMNPTVGAAPHVDGAARIVDLEPLPARGVEHLLALLPQGVGRGRRAGPGHGEGPGGQGRQDGESAQPGVLHALHYGPGPSGVAPSGHAIRK